MKRRTGPLAAELLRRRRAFEDEVPWRFEQTPQNVGNPPQDNPMRRAAIFVVHGMGNQEPVETAITFRNGIEDAIEAILTEHATDLMPGLDRWHTLASSEH